MVTFNELSKIIQSDKESAPDDKQRLEHILPKKPGTATELKTTEEVTRLWDSLLTHIQYDQADKFIPPLDYDKNNNSVYLNAKLALLQALQRLMLTEGKDFDSTFITPPQQIDSIQTL